MGTLKGIIKEKNLVTDKFNRTETFEELDRRLEGIINKAKEVE